MTVKSTDHPMLTRMDSDTTMRMVNNEGIFCGVCLVIVDRTMSGYLGPPTVKKAGKTYGKINPGKNQQRVVSTGEISYKEAVETEPMLVRSGGIRRDWSFENLYQCGKDLKRNGIDNKPNGPPTATTI